MILASSKAAQSTSAAIAPRNDWREQFRQSFTEPAELLLALELQDLTSQLSADVRRFPMRVPRAYVARMRLGDRTDPLLRQVLPLSAEDQITPGYRLDAVGDHMARTAQGVLQKYHGRALLIATGSCAINCRYCFRRHYPYSDILDDQLVFRLARESGHPAGGHHFHPLFGPHLHARDLALPGNRGDDGAVILEVEIQMPRGRARDAAHLAAHADKAELALDHPLHRAGQFRHGVFGLVSGGGGGVFEHVHADVLPAAFGQGNLCPFIPAQISRRPEGWPPVALVSLPPPPYEAAITDGDDKRAGAA